MNAQREDLALEPIEGVVTEAPVRQAIATTSPTPGDILAMAYARGNVDLDQLERLMVMKREWDTIEAEKAFTLAMTAFKAEKIEVLKSKHVSFPTAKGTTSYNHAELSDVVDAAIVGMAKHGLSHSWDLDQEGGVIKVTCVITHAQGHSKRVSMSATKEDSGTKNHIQAMASTITYLERYTLKAALGIAEKGTDDDGRSAGPAVRQSRGEAAAQAAQPSGSPERDKIVDDLYAVADNGLKPLLAAWQALPEKSRTLVGSEFGAIKAKAQKVAA